MPSKLHTWLDRGCCVYFVINLAFITYIVDLEQLVIEDADAFEYPVWPPAPLVDIIHWYGRNFDPVLIARPPWWKFTIWVDVLFFGPFYAFALYCYRKRLNRIRPFAIAYSFTLITIVTLILFNEVAGPVPARNLPLVVALNFPWLAVPCILLYRHLNTMTPFEPRFEVEEVELLPVAAI